MRRRALLASSSGGSESGNFGEEFTFYINPYPFGSIHELKALDGMAWSDYVTSEYNTIGLELSYIPSLSFYGVAYPPGIFHIVGDGGATENASNLIVPGFVYFTG